MSYNVVGENIKKYRTLKKISQTRLGQILGDGKDVKPKSLSTIQKYESGAIDPPLPVIKEIARVLEVEVGDLLGHTELENRIEEVKKRNIKFSGIENFHNNPIIDFYQYIDADFSEIFIPLFDDSSPLKLNSNELKSIYKNSRGFIEYELKKILEVKFSLLESEEEGE